MAIDATMRAACITEPGSPEAIQVGELPVPVPGPTDVLVAVEVSAVNPADTFIRSGRYPTPMPLPFVVGRDLVGTVTAVCPGSGFAPGERVWCNSLGHGGRQGSCATYAVVPADRLYPLPDGAEPAAVVAAFHESACDGLSVVSERERQRRITSDTCKNLPQLNQTIYSTSIQGFCISSL